MHAGHGLHLPAGHRCGQPGTAILPAFMQHQGGGIAGFCRQLQAPAGSKVCFFQFSDHPGKGAAAQGFFKHPEPVCSLTDVGDDEYLPRLQPVTGQPRQIQPLSGF